MKTINQKITEQFLKCGYTKDSFLTEQQAYLILDIIAFQNACISQFDRAIAQQMWQRTKKINNSVKIGELISTIVQGQKLIKFHIANKQQQHKFQKNQKIRQRLKAQIFTLVKDYELISNTFKLDSITRNSIIKASEKQYQAILKDRSGVFQFQPSPGPQSFSLKIVFLATLLSLVTEFYLLFGKRSFIHILALQSVLLIFFMNYFDKNYIKFCLFILAGSNIIDIASFALFVKIQTSKAGIQPFPQSSLFAFQFSIMLHASSIIIKTVIFILIFRYRNNERNVKKTVQCFGMKFFLNAKQHPFKKNPITLIYENHCRLQVSSDVPTQY